jgi:DNA polymerase-3 subunit delta'
MFENFYGNQRVVAALENMIAQDRTPQTLLLAGPEGVGKATLGRRLATRLLGHREKIEQDDLSLSHNVSYLEERKKWPSNRRSEEPLFFASHPDFLTFPPDGPLRQISIQQMRLLKEFAQYKPQSGARRVFLIDHIDRAGEQAANSLLKILEEPPDYLTLVVTAENAYDLLPTIRSRSVPLYLAPLDDNEMKRFVAARGLDQAERRIALASGCPGITVSLDLEEYDRRREAMCMLIQVAAGISPFSAWLEYSDSIAASRQENLEVYLKILYGLLSDLLIVQQTGAWIQNIDLRGEIEKLAAQVSFDWIRAAVVKVDDLAELVRRNIQKQIALDALILELRSDTALAAS